MADANGNSRLQWWSHVMGIISGAATAVALLTGLVIFKLTSDDQNRAQTLGLLQEHLKLSVENPKLAHGAPAAGDEEKYDSFVSHALFTTETIYLLQEGDEGWESTVKGILQNHSKAIDEQGLRCGDFNPRFIAFLKKDMPNLKCTD